MIDLMFTLLMTMEAKVSVLIAISHDDVGHENEN